MNAKPIHEIDQMLGKADADGHVANSVFENQVPTDDPGDEFTHRGVSISVGAAGNRNHGSEFGVANGGEATGDGHQNERESDGRPGAGTAKRGGVVNQVLEQRGIENGRRLKFLAGDGGADNGEDSGADDGANAKRGEAEPAEGLF